MAQTLEKMAVPELGALLQEHQEVVTLGRELIRLSICARVLGRISDARAAERAAEEYFAVAIGLEEVLKAQL
jgi:hypothetical protein